MYRLTIITILTFLCGFLCYSVFQQLNNALLKQQDPFAAIPLDAAIILESNELQQVWSTFSETNLIWKEFLANEKVNSIDVHLKKVDSIISETSALQRLFIDKNTVISVHPYSETYDFLTVTNCELIDYESVVDFFNSIAQKSSTINIKSSEFIELSIDSSKYFVSYQEPFFLITSSEELMNKSVLQLESNTNLLTNTTFSQLRLSASPSSNFHLFFQKKQLTGFLNNFFNEQFVSQISSSNEFLDWIELDLLLKPNSIMLSGLSALSMDTLRPDYLPFQESISKQGDGQFPSNISSLERHSIKDINSLLKSSRLSIEDIENKCNCQLDQELKKLLGNEVVKVCFKDNLRQLHEAVFVEELGSVNAFDLLKKVYNVDTSIVLSNGFEALVLSDLDFVNFFGFDLPDKNRYLILIENYFVISSKEGLIKIIKDLSRNSNSKENSLYRRFSNQYLSSHTSKELFISGETMLKLLNASIKQSMSLESMGLSSIFNKVDGLAVESSSLEQESRHHSFVMSIGQSNMEESKYLWLLDLDSISIKPQLCKNHRTNTSEVLVQELNNKIHLISANGRIKWSKKIDGQIMGDVKQIDLYKNGKWQMLFNTKTHIYLLDINGKQVFDNPIALKSEATNSVSVIDYDGKLDYRILIACADNKIYNYNGEGKEVNGWNIFQAKKRVTTSIKYFSISGKDYLFFYDKSGEMYFLNRRGETRYNPSFSLLDLKSEEIQFSKGKSVEDSKLIYIDSSSRVVEKALSGNFAEKIALDSSYSNESPLIHVVDFSGNGIFEYVVSIAEKIANYGPDKKLGIFESFNFQVDENLTILGESEKYILIENNKQEEIYLFDSNLSANDVFPVPGSLKSVIGDLNRDGLLELVTVYKGKIIAYTISPEGY